MKKLNFKKCMRVFIIVLICCVPLYCGWKHYYNNYILVQNVFDHMYYAKAYINLISEERPLEMDYHKMDICRFDREGYIDTVSYYDKYLNSPFDLPNLDIKLEIDSPLLPILEIDDYDISEYGGMYITGTIKFGETNKDPYEDRIIMRYYYNVSDKTLKSELYIRRTYSDENIEPERYVHGEDNEDIKSILNEREVSEEDILKIREWMLYDKVLTDWFKANEGKTRFSMDDLGKVEFIE